MGGSPVTRVSGTRVPTSARDHASGRTRHQGAQEYGIESRPVMAQGKGGIMRQTTGGTTRGKPDWKGGGPPLGAWRFSTYRPDETHAKGGPPPVASHLGILKGF